MRVPRGFPVAFLLMAVMERQRVDAEMIYGSFNGVVEYDSQAYQNAQPSNGPAGSDPATLSFSLDTTEEMLTISIDDSRNNLFFPFSGNTLGTPFSFSVSPNALSVSGEGDPIFYEGLSLLAVSATWLSISPDGLINPGGADVLAEIREPDLDPNDTGYDISIDFHSVPEPSSIVLMTAAGIGVLCSLGSY